MNVLSSIPSFRSHASTRKIDVPPSKGSLVFQESQRDQFERSADAFLNGYDKAGLRGENRGKVEGGFVTAAAAALIIGGSLAIGTNLIELMIATAATGIIGAIALPAAMEGRKSQAEAQFVRSNPAPYLQTTTGCWKTATRSTVCNQLT